MPDANNTTLINDHCVEYERYDRRAFLAGGGRSLAAMLFGNTLADLPNWAPRIALADPVQGQRGDTLVCIFLRGGADGLNMIVPFGEDRYYDLRPNLAVGRPDDSRAAAKAVDLDGFFGLHPALSPLKPIYDEGDLLAVQAVGSPHGSRSHFEAMAYMERGVLDTGGDYSGWLARHLLTLDTGNTSPLRALAISDMVPASLGGSEAIPVPSLDDYQLATAGNADALKEALQALYHDPGDLLTGSAQRTTEAINLIRGVSENYAPAAGVSYGDTDFGLGLQAVARLIKADVGVEVASVDLGGWDTHAVQGTEEGLQPGLMTELSGALIAFYEDLGDAMQNVSVVIMTEFGRRARENAARGTDHGYGSMMLLLGGGVNGGQVYSAWPGLAEEQLAGPGDLDITTDYRDVLAELVVSRLNNPQPQAVFPGYAPNELGLLVPRSL